MSGHPGAERRPRHIVRIIARLNVGGPSIQAITLAASMSALGYETDLVRGQEGPREGSMDALFERLGVMPTTLSQLRRRIGLRDFVAFSQLWYLLHRGTPDIVHTHAAKAGTLGRLAALIGPRRPAVLVHTFHGHVLEGYFSAWTERRFQAIERWLAARTDCLIAVSPEVRDDLIRLRIAPPDKVRVVPLGFDLGRFMIGESERGRRAADFRSRWSIDADCRLVTLVARLAPIKRVDRFLRIADLLADDPRLHFLIVGDGELHDQLRASAESLRLGARVTWTGFIDQIEDVHFASDVVVLTSDNEGTPVSLIEAHAAGVPVVSTNVGGVRSVVEQGVSGVLVAPDDDRAFAAAIARLTGDTTLARLYGAAGRRDAIERFTLERLTANLDGLYRELANAQRRRHRAGDRIRVMFAIGSLGTGGSEKQLVELLPRLARDRFEPVLVTVDEALADDGHLEVLRGAGIPVVCITPSGARRLSRWARRARSYADILKAIDPDVVYAWLDETAAFLAPICRIRGVPCLVARRNVIGSMTERANRRAAASIHWAEARATLVTANSAAVAAECVARGHRPDRVRLVANGHAHLPALPTPPGSPIVFGYVAQFRPEKGHCRLIDALRRMPAGDWRVDLAGDGPLRPKIEALVAGAQLGDRVRLVGQITDVRAFWRDRHAAILLSDSEGSPNALIEAAFAGRAAVATDSGGTRDVVGEAGILVGLDDPAAVVAALSKLIADPVELQRRGQMAWAHASRAFSIDRMVEGHAVALEETMTIAAQHRLHGPRQTVMEPHGRAVTEFPSRP